LFNKIVNVSFQIKESKTRNMSLPFFAAHSWTVRVLFLAMFLPGELRAQMDLHKEVIVVLRPDVLATVTWAVQQEPVTVTSSSSPRSAGGPHDFFSEADYWWPDPANPDGPYIQRDGQTNPDNFVDHRKEMIRFGQIVGSLASAYLITGENQYVTQILRHAKAWFVDAETMMNPSLLYAQAIKGRVTGRGIGIIDTIHLMEVAQGILVIENAKGVDKKLIADIKTWFAQYLQWLTKHQYGKDEMNALNNHGTCWVMQVASFARLTGDQKLLEFCRARYKTVLLPGQMGVDGSFPRELARTKPYGYSLFNLDAMATICQLLSTESDNLWNFKLEDGRGIRKGIEFLYPFVKNKSAWPHKPDVMYWNEWPIAHPFLLFGADAFDERTWFDLWVKLDHHPKVEEVVRNLPVRNPIIWLSSH
jgi:hypothetical protein